MTQKRKYEILDKELRTKYEHLSDYEYQQVRTKYIKSLRRKLWLKGFFRGIVIPFSTGGLLMALVESFIGSYLPDIAAGFLALLCSTASLIWMGIELYKSHAERDMLPAVDAGLLTFKQISKDFGLSGLVTSLMLIFMTSPLLFASNVGDGVRRVWVVAALVVLSLGIGFDILHRWKWKTGKYSLVVRRAVTKGLDQGGIEDSDTYWLVFESPGSKNIKYRVSGSKYNDMKTGDLYYLVLKKKRNGKEKILRCYKAELITLDDELKAMLQK